MARLQKKSFAAPDEKSATPRSKMDMVKFGGLSLSKITFEPGWKWSVNASPIAGTKSCQKHHFAYCLSGRMGIRLDDGSTMEFGVGDVVDIPPGHDGWVLGDEPVVLLEFGIPAV